MGASGSYLKAKADALRILHRSKEDKQAVDFQTQIQDQEHSLEEIDKSFRSIRFILYNNSPFSLVLSDFRLSDGVLWMVQPPPQLQPGDCALFGAFVQDEKAYDPSWPLCGRLVYEGKLPTVHFLTKEEERKQKKEEERRKKQERKWAETNALAHVARVQALKDRQALRKLEKSKSRDGNHLTGDDNASNATDDGSESMDISDLLESTVSEQDGASTQANGGDSTDDSDDQATPSKKKRKTKRGTHKSTEKTKRRKHRRTSSNGSSQPSQADNESDKSVHVDGKAHTPTKAHHTKAGRRKSTPAQTRSNRPHDHRLTTSASPSTAKGPATTSIPVSNLNEEEEGPYPTSSAPTAISPIAQATASENDVSVDGSSDASSEAPVKPSRSKKHKNVVPPIELPSLSSKTDQSLESSVDSNTKTPGSTPRSRPSTEYAAPGSTELNSSRRGPRTLPSFITRKMRSPDSPSTGMDESGESKGDTAGDGPIPTSTRSARANSVSSTASASHLPLGTPRTSTSHGAPQLIVSWAVHAIEAEFEETCSMLHVAFNELTDQTQGHASLLIEVQERLTPPTESVEDTSSSAAVDVAQGPTSPSDAPVVLPIEASASPSNSSSDLPSQLKLSHGVNADPRFKPINRVQRAMSAAYLRSAATLKRAELERLEEQTYFDQDEIRELHVLFSKISGYTSHITVETFNAFMPELSDPALRGAMFTAFDKSHDYDERITFEEFVLSLSAMCRGTPEDQAKIVFDMCSDAKLGSSSATVTREQVLKLVTRVGSAMHAAGFPVRDYGNPVQAVNNVFLKGGEASMLQAAAGMSMKDRIVVLAKGIAHTRRDEREAARNQAKADLQERQDVDDDVQDTITDNESDEYDSSGNEADTTSDTDSAPHEPPSRLKQLLSLRSSKDNLKLSTSGDRKRDIKGPEQHREGFFSRAGLGGSKSSIRRTESYKNRVSPRPPKADSSAIPPPQTSFIDLYGPEFPRKSSSPNVATSSDVIKATNEKPIEEPATLANASLTIPRPVDVDEDDESDLLTARSDESETKSTQEATSAVSSSAPSGASSAELDTVQPASAIPPIRILEASTSEDSSQKSSAEGGESSKSPRHKKLKDSRKKKSQEAPVEVIEIEAQHVAEPPASVRHVAFVNDDGDDEVPSDAETDSPHSPKSGTDSETKPLKGVLSHKRSSTPVPNSPGRTGIPGSPQPTRRSAATQRITTTHFEPVLTRKQFIMRCKNEPDLAECFGLFDFFNASVVEPLVKLSAERSVWQRVSIAGPMVKERGSMSRKIGGWGDKRYFMLKDGFLGYSKRPGGPLLRAIPLFSASIKPNISDKKFALTIIAPYFHRKLSLPTAEQAQLWVHAIRSSVRGKHRFKSFVPPRKNIAVRPFMNGKEYFDALVPILSRCKRRLFISGWYLSPGLVLKRGAFGASMDSFRLDNIILDAANRGVSVYIIIYNAPGFTGFDLQPTYVCDFFNNLHPNIRTLMHPNNYVPSMWSHHQKLVVCDESVAFIGGIDLCYGRYEDSDYSITDVNESKYPGRDYCNVFLENESNGPSEQAVVDRQTQPRMPWSDVQVQLSGMAAYDVALNFMQRWDHIVREGTTECKPMPFLFPSHSVCDVEQKIGTIDATTGQPFPSVEVQMLTADARPSNPDLSSARESERSHTEEVDSSSDEQSGSAHSGTSGEEGHKKGKKPKKHHHPHLHRHHHTHQEEEEDSFHFVANPEQSTLIVPEIPWDSRVPYENVELSDEDLGCAGCNVQIVRSVATWSAGTSAPEQSIYKAYVDLITEARHLIFIQNQYFISSIDRSAPKNRLLDALYRRLKVAIENKQDFRVLILVPVLPGGGDIESASTRYMLKYTYRTISRGGHSLLEKLQQDYPGVDVHQYVKFGTPRQIGRLGETLVSEPVYIHSKVMIVDDCRAIIGSANINDRSLRGTRDSEVACVIELGSPQSRCEGLMNAKPFEVCRPVHELRVRMWADMVGVKINSAKPEDVEMLETLKDPFTGLNLLMHRAELNTKAYLRVFPGMIPNTIYRIAEFKRALVSIGTEVDPIVREQRLEDMGLIRGIITSWPFEFLKDEPIGIGFFEKEYMVPRIIFL